MIKKANILLSTYLILIGLTNGYQFCLILSKISNYNLFTTVLIFLLAVTIVGVVLNNFVILKTINNVSKNNLVVNLVICILQILSFSINGFQYKFNQGIEVAIYAEFSPNLSSSKFGTFLDLPNLALKIDFMKLDSLLIGVNVLNILIAGFYYCQIRKIKQSRV